MRRLANVIEKTADVSGYCAGWLVPLMMLLIVYEVFMRYVLHQPPMIADEFSAYMLVALAYIGMAFTWRRKGHVRLTILTSRLPTKVSTWIRLVIIILATAFSFMLVKVSYEMVTYAFERNLRSATWVVTPLSWPQLPILIGFSIMSLLLVVEIAKAIVKICSGERIEETTT